MTDVQVFPRWTPRTGFGGVDSVIEGVTTNSWVIASSDATADLTGWYIAGYTEALFWVENMEAAGSDIEFMIEGSLERSRWTNIPMYNRDDDDFVVSYSLSSEEVNYETLESDRWHYVRIRVRTVNGLKAADTCSYLVAVGAATL